MYDWKNNIMVDIQSWLAIQTLDCDNECTGDRDRWVGGSNSLLLFLLYQLVLLLADEKG